MNSLKLWRNIKGYSQILLGSKVGCSGTQIHYFEQGYSKPSPVMKKKISEVLEIDKEILFGSEKIQVNVNGKNIGVL